MPIPRREIDRLKIFPFAPFLRPHNPPLTDICESPLVCVSVNAEWASFMVGALDVLDQPDLWIGTEEEKEAALQKVRSIISMFVNPCADDSSEYTTIINQWRHYQTTLEGLYDGTPESVDEDAPDTNFDSNSSDTVLEASYRGDALCAACRILVDVFCAELLAQAGEFQAANNILAGLFAAATGGVGGLIGLIIVVAVDVLSNIATAALEDEQARENVACCIYSNMQGLAISQANFCTSIDGCYETGSSHENDIMNGFRASDFCRRGNYVGFLKIIAEQFRYARAGITDPCMCGCSFVFTFDEETGYTIVEGTRQLLIDDDYKIEGESYNVSGQPKGVHAEVSLPLDDTCPVEIVRVVYAFDHGTASNDIGFEITLKLAGIVVDNYTETLDAPKNTWNTHDFEFFAECDEVVVRIAFQNTILNSVDGKFVRLNTITINP